mgnify:FL=1
MEASEDGLIKFPRTRHIFDSGGNAVGRDDLLMEENEAKIWYEAVVTVEEKVDGSNLGMCFCIAGSTQPKHLHLRLSYRSLIPDTQASPLRRTM